MKILEKCRSIIVAKKNDEKEEEKLFERESRDIRNSSYKLNTYKYKSSYKLKY